MKTKSCSKCKQAKTTDCFYKDRSRWHGLSARCKDCERLHCRKKREQNLKTFLIKDKKYYDIHKKEIKQKRKDAYFENRFKHRARSAVESALYRGVLKRPDTCSLCSKDRNIQAHHEDYGKPLQVLWLCATCHQRKHSKYGA